MLNRHTDFDHVTLGVTRTFKVNGSKVKVTTWHNVSTLKTLNSGTDKLSKVRCGENYLRVERIRYTALKILVKYWNRNNSAAYWSIGFKFGIQSFITSQTIGLHCKCSRSKVKVTGSRSKSQREVMYQQQNAIIRQWISSATSNVAWRRKAEKNWRGVGRPQVAMNCHVSSLPTDLPGHRPIISNHLGNHLVVYAIVLLF